MQRSLLMLKKSFREKVYALLAELAEYRIYMVITETSRTEERQAWLFDRGLTRTMNSKHLLDLAVDMYPVGKYEYPKVTKVVFELDNPVWQKIGAAAERHKIFWGGRWENFKDYGHFEELDYHE